jgi:hypothetical protein
VCEFSAVQLTAVKSSTFLSPRIVLSSEISPSGDDFFNIKNARRLSGRQWRGAIADGVDRHLEHLERGRAVRLHAADAAHADLQTGDEEQQQQHLVVVVVESVVAVEQRPQRISQHSGGVFAHFEDDRAGFPPLSHTEPRG